MTMALGIPAFASETVSTETLSPVEFDSIEFAPVEDSEIMPLDLGIDDGTIDNFSGLDVTRKLNRKNGEYVNLYVENKGTNAVIATINGKNERTFQPGEVGHISAEVTQGLFGTDKSYRFKVVTGKSGGSVKINYVIAQRDAK